MTCDLCIPCLEGSPFLNLSAEGPEPFFYRALGYCCDGQLLEYESTESAADAQINMLRLLQTECPQCGEPRKFCADATCPDGTVLTTVCVETSQLDADAIAAAKASAMADFCNDLGSLFSYTCTTPNGSEVTTTYSNISEAVAQAECEDIPHTVTTDTLSTNDEQTCTMSCSDGTPWTYSIAAGTFYANTKAEANATAYSYACLLAFLSLKCCNLNSSLANGTVGSVYAQQLTSSLSSPLWVVASGSLPPGLTLNSATGVISGTPTTAGWAAQLPSDNPLRNRLDMPRGYRRSPTCCG